MGQHGGEWCPYGMGDLSPELPLDQREEDGGSLTYPDLYRPFGRSAVVRIEDGALVLRSLQVPGIGFKPTPDMDAMQPPDAWLAAHGRDADLGS